MSEILLYGGKVWGHQGVTDILVRDGHIAALGNDLAGGTAERVDATGQVILPGLVDAHAHLDKTLHGGPWIPHSATDVLADRIGNERRRRFELGLPRAEAMASLLDRMVVAGTTHLRTHTDIDPEVGLRRVEAVGEAADRMRDRIEVTQVAFPQYGILTQPGTADLLDAALRGGVAAIGGIDPAGVDGDPVRHLDIVFGLAEKHGADIDLHLHDGGTLGAWELELIADRTAATGLGGRVTVSHAYALGQLEPAEQARLADRLAATCVSITTSATYSFPVPPLKVLHAAGVNVAAGNDCIRDLWGPYGTGDMLERGMLIAYRSGFRRDEDIELALRAVTHGGAATLRLPRYGLAVGAQADLVVVPAEVPAEAIVAHPTPTLVLKSGRCISHDGVRH
jgi:cytosine/creatinine deaminase